MENDYHKTAIDWALICNKAIDDYLALTEEFLLESSDIEAKLQWILKHLAISCNSTSNSALLLIQYNQMWDAEILLRSIVEGTIKYAYLCIGSEEELQMKAADFLDVLPEIDTLTAHKRVTTFLTSTEDPNNSDWDILKEELLDILDFQKLQTKYPRKVTNTLKQKWSFNEMIREISETQSNFEGFESVRRLLSYSYGVSSHLTHKDGTALKLIKDHNSQAKKNSKIGLAFISRQLNDLVLMASFRSFMTFILYQVKPQPVIDLYNSHMDLLNEMLSVRTEWYQSFKTQ